MKASALKYAILSVLSSTIVVILLLMPLHAFLTVWGSAIFGHYTALRLWKEVLLLGCLLGVVYLLLTDQKIRSHTMTRRLVWVILLYAVWAVLRGLLAYHQQEVDLKALGYGLLVDLRFPAFFLATWAVALRTAKLRDSWRMAVIWPAVVVIIFGLLQVLVLPLNFLAHFGYGPNTIPAYETINHNLHYVRIMSTLRGANPLGAYILIPLSLSVVLLVRGQSRLRYGLLLFGSLLMLYFSFSRSAWIGAVLSVVVILGLSLRSAQAKRLAAVAVSVVLVLGVVGGVAFRHNSHFENLFLHTQTHSAIKTTSDQGHAAALRNGLHDIVHQPLGDGPGSAGPASIYNNHPGRIAENYFIQIGQEMGWIGLGLFVLINLGVGYLLWSRRADPLALSLFASLIGLTFVNLLSHAWADDTLAYVWWGLAGITMAPMHPRVKKQAIDEAIS